MKTKIIAAAFAAMAASGSYAVTMSGNVAVCDDGTAKSVPIALAASPGFIQETFNQGCSNNVYMNVGENNIMAWAASASKKGKYYFIGNTNGGAPRAKTSALVDPATAPAPTDHMADAEALGSS